MHSAALHVMTAVSRQLPGTVHVAVTGELDAETTPMLYATVRELDRPTVVELGQRSCLRQAGS